MLRIVAVAAAIAVGATAVYAQNAAGIAARKEAFKAMGGAMGGPGKMIKGEAPFDLAAVQKSLDTLAEQSAKVKGLFGDDTKTGETNALPVAFEKKADLAARFDKLVADAKAAKVAIKNEASFKAEWGKIGANCGGCHKEYLKPTAYSGRSLSELPTAPVLPTPARLAFPDAACADLRPSMR
jgi:cytochrome c556